MSSPPPGRPLDEGGWLSVGVGGDIPNWPSFSNCGAPGKGASMASGPPDSDIVAGVLGSGMPVLSCVSLNIADVPPVSPMEPLSRAMKFPGLTYTDSGIMDPGTLRTSSYGAICGLGACPLLNSMGGSSICTGGGSLAALGGGGYRGGGGGKACCPPGSEGNCGIPGRPPAPGGGGGNAGMLPAPPGALGGNGGKRNAGGMPPTLATFAISARPPGGCGMPPGGGGGNCK